MKHGLGKGLDALFELNEDEKNVSTIDIDNISRDPSQPRKHFNKEELEALTQSIVQNGVIQPIIVRQTTSGHTIVAGERRFRAAKQAGLTEIPIIIKDLTDLQVLEISLVENIQREENLKKEYALKTGEIEKKLEALKKKHFFTSFIMENSDQDNFEVDIVATVMEKGTCNLNDLKKQLNVTPIMAVRTIRQLAVKEIINLDEDTNEITMH